MMIHEAWGMAMGTAGDMRKSAESLDKMTSSIAGIYASRSGKDTAHWLALMAAESWFSDQEAVVAGLADSVIGTKPTSPKAQLEETKPGTAARRQLAAAYLEVIHAYAA
jgi:ATP-dependent protease ClpP protease subunit